MQNYWLNHVLHQFAKVEREVEFLPIALVGSIVNRLLGTGNGSL